MFKKIKVLALITCALSLSACLKVEDKSSDKVADAITEQNRILQQQAAQTQTQTTITLTGIINNLDTGLKAISATVTVKMGSTSTAPVDVNNGAFQISGLPADSNVELIVHSTAGAFMDRVVFLKTRATNSQGIVYQELAPISVSAGVEHTFTILNASTNAAISNLVLRANSNLGDGANYEQYLHTSTYDSATQKYKITLPERLDLSIYAKLDVNNDGKTDYQAESQNFGNNEQLFIPFTQVKNANSIYLIDLNVRALIKISLLDSAFKPLVGAKPSVVDILNGTLNATYNSTTSQYIIDATIGDSLTAMVPSFVMNNLTYNSSSIRISRVPSVGSSRYSLSTSSNFNPTYFNFTKDEPQVFEVVLQPTSNTTFSNLSVNSISTLADVVTEGFKVFYSGSVALTENTVKLTRKNVLKVTRGDASATDLILAGTTLIEVVDEPVETTSQLTLNNTLLSVTPKTSLTTGYYYNYTIGTLKDTYLNINVDLNNDFLFFYEKNSTPFAIADMKVDNNNYYTNGSLIKATNTAGEAANPQNFFGQSVLLYLPTSIGSLKTLTLRKEKSVINNIESNNIQNLNIVVNGEINFSNPAQTVSLAANEYVPQDFSLPFNIYRGAAIGDGNWYVVSLNESAMDNTSINTNTISFSYALETKAGVTETGTITLPVL